MKRSFAIMVRVDERLKQATEQAAMDDQRSVASLIQKLIVDFLTESGYIDGKRQLSANNLKNDPDDDPDDNNGANGTNRANDAPGQNEGGTNKRARANRNGHLDSEEQNDVNLRVQSLTPREREVLELFVAGNTDDKIASYLNTSAKIVQASRAMITEKIGADSLPYLIRVIVRRELQDLTALNANS